MTNEEKATEIAIKICGEPSPDDITGEYPCAEDAALEMAKWKDNQFKEYLKKKIYEFIPHSMGWVAIEETIDEFFKED